MSYEYKIIFFGTSWDLQLDEAAKDGWRIVPGGYSSFIMMEREAEKSLNPSAWKGAETPEEIKEALATVDRVLGAGDYDAVKHVHGAPGSCRQVEHTHAWGSEPHSHILRAVCGRPECKGWPTHNVQHHDGDGVEF
jgi:hypothetical protein